MSYRPNILLLVDDSHRADVMSVEGNAHIRMPVLDQLIKRGTYFNSAYSPAPTCTSARHSLLTGLYPRHNNCISTNLLLSNDVLTIPGHLSRYGYQTVCAGKMNFVDTDQMHGWHERIGRDIAVPIIKTKSTRTKKELIRNIFGNGETTNYWIQRDRYCVDGALMFLDEYFISEPYDRPGHRPLFLAVSLNSAQHPLCCEKKLLDHYIDRVQPFVDEPLNEFNCRELNGIRIGEDISYADAERATAAYYGMIDLADLQFGRIISKLEALAVLDNFVVVFLSDHGEMLGQKGLWGAQQFYEGSVRVPFFISAPQLIPAPVAHTAKNVSLVDLFPTLCDIAHVPIPPDLDGRSVTSIMTRNSQTEKNQVFSELYHDSSCYSEMIKRDHLKYFRSSDNTNPEQLFDLSVDPDESDNVINNEAYALHLQQLRTRLDKFS